MYFVPGFSYFFFGSEFQKLSQVFMAQRDGWMDGGEWKSYNTGCSVPYHLFAFILGLGSDEASFQNLPKLKPMPSQAVSYRKSFQLGISNFSGCLITAQVTVTHSFPWKLNEYLKLWNPECFSMYTRPETRRHIFDLTLPSALTLIDMKKWLLVFYIWKSSGSNLKRRKKIMTLLKDLLSALRIYLWLGALWAGFETPKAHVLLSSEKKNIWSP